MALVEEHACSRKGNFSEQGNDDWISLMLQDVEFDDSPVPLSSLANLPMPDLDDMMDLTSLENSDCNSSSSNSVCIHGQALSPSDGNLHGNRRQMFHGNSSPSHGEFSSPLPADQEVVTGEYNCNVECAVQGFYQKENVFQGIGDASSPRTACNGFVSMSENNGCKRDVSQGPSIVEGDSGFEDDNLYFLVSEICGDGNTSNYHTGDGSGASTNNDPTHKQMDIKYVDGNVKSETGGKIMRKRKAIDRTTRSRSPEGSSVDCGEGVENAHKDEDEEKRQARLMRNRESAQLSRQRKKLYIDELEEKIKTMASTIAELNNTINLISAENINLRRQLGAFAPTPGHLAGMPGVIPWMGPYASAPVMGGRFVAPGSQVPLVPIPKWKSQTTSLKKTKKATSDAEEKGATVKAPKRTKKAAGVAAVGLLFFLFVLLPTSFLDLTNTVVKKDSKVWSSSSSSLNSVNLGIRTGGRVLTSVDDGNDSEYSVNNQDQQSYRSDHQSSKTHSNSSFDRNGTVPLAATLFVPRNDRLERIEGNLIIHSVLAGDRAALQSLNRTGSESVKMHVTNQKSQSLDANLKAIAVKAAPEEKGALVELQKVLARRTSHELDEGSIKSLHENGPFQQWFLEDLAGPVFSSGMCTEVFQFETAVPVSSSPSTPNSRTDETNNLIRNNTRRLQEAGQRRMGRSGMPSRKRVPYAVPLPPVGYKDIHKIQKNNTQMGSGQGFQSDKDSQDIKQARSSIVVSLLAGLDVGDQTKITGGGKSLSRIFVVVLIDSVKYVTYSCMLPSAGPKPHYEVVTV